MCGIFCVTSLTGAHSLETGLMMMEGLQGLQHRGKESAGATILTEVNNSIFTKAWKWASNGFTWDQSFSKRKVLKTFKGLGLVQEAIPWSWIASRPCSAALGHTRYSTMGAGVAKKDRRTLGAKRSALTDFKTRNAQPFYMPKKNPIHALTHNGTLVNALELREFLAAKGVKFVSETDTEVIPQLTEYFRKTEGLSLTDSVIRCMKMLEGSFSCIMVTSDGVVYAFRDRFGNRPLKVAKTETHLIISSESCAWHKFGAQYISSVGEGELWEIRGDQIKKTQVLHEEFKAHCIFENIYLKSPNTNLTSDHNRKGGNGTVGEFRYKLGKKPAIRKRIGPAIIIPIMESGELYGLGFQFEHNEQNPGLSWYHNALPKDKTIGRAFIEPTIEDRLETLKRKIFNLFDSARDKINILLKLPGKVRIVCTDDSLLRADTSRQIISRIRGILEEMYPGQSDRFEIIWVVGSPPVKYPCYHGIDFPTVAELIAANMSIEEICKKIGADQLIYLTLEDLEDVVGPEYRHFCKACFTGIYPIPIPKNQGKDSLIRTA